MTEWIRLYGESVKTAAGFFWKSGWAFVLGYSVSAMIQVFVPKGRLTKYMGEANLKSVSLATVFGTVSSSCSFAALAAARALVKKGAHFVVAVAFMFASTNLVIELGILILIFLGWQFLAAEFIGGSCPPAQAAPWLASTNAEGPCPPVPECIRLIEALHAHADCVNGPFRRLHATFAVR